MRQISNGNIKDIEKTVMGTSCGLILISNK